MKNWLFSDGKQKLLEGFCCISMGWVVKVESKKKSAAMKWFPLHKTKVLGGAPDISLGQKYLTTADPFDPNYNTPDQHRDLKKLTCPTIYAWKNWFLLIFVVRSMYATFRKEPRFFSFPFWRDFWLRDFFRQFLTLYGRIRRFDSFQ